jgi:hypothetical protein
MTKKARTESKSSGVSYTMLAGSWLVDAGPNQLKTVTSYSPLGDGKFAAVESVLNFDWTLEGAKPTATHATTLNGVLEKKKDTIDFVLISYVLDKDEKAVYIFKAVGNKVLVDEDTISVQNLIIHIYNDPETANPVTDTADFTIPSSGTFPPVHEYRIQF